MISKDLEEKNKRLLHEIAELSVSINYYRNRLEKLNSEIEISNDIYKEKIKRLEEIKNRLS